MTRDSGVTAVVLAGGKGMRLGGNKLSQMIGDQTLLERVLIRVALLSDEVFLSLAPGQSPPASTGAAVSIIPDIYPGKGAIGGLHAALTASTRPLSLVVAGDMPFLNIELLRHMISLVTGSDAVVPRVDGKDHPLHAIYDRRCLPVIQDQIDKGSLRMMDLLARLKVRYLDKDDIDKLDPQHLSMFNINTQADLQRARRLAAQE